MGEPASTLEALRLGPTRGRTAQPQVQVRDGYGVSAVTPGREERRRRASYAESLGFGGMSVLASISLGLVSSVAIARLYGVHVLGQFALVSAPSMSMAYLSTAQEQVALVREVSVLPPRHPRVTGLFAAVLTFSVALTVVAALVVLGGTWLLFRGPIHQPELFVPAAVSMAIFVVLTNTCWNLDMLLSAFRAGRELFWVRLSQTLAFLAAAIGFAVVTDGVYGLIWATALSWAAALVLRCVVLPRFVRIRVEGDEIRAGFRALPELIRFGLRLAPRNIASGLSAQFATWSLGANATVAAVGAFNRASQLSTRFMDVSFRISELLIPTLAERRKQGDTAGFDRAMVDTLRLAAFATLLPAAAGGGAAVGIMQLFGPGFEQAATALTLLLLGPVMTCLSSIQVQSLVVANRPGRASVVTLCRAAVTLACTIPLVARFGISGAAAGWIIGFTFELAWQQRLTRKELAADIRHLWRARQMLAQVIAYAAGFAAARATDAAVQGAAGLVPALLAGVAAYVVAFLLAGGFGARDVARLERLRKRLAQRRTSALGV